MADNTGGKILAGAFFADDQIIWDVVLCDGETPPPFSQYQTTKKIELPKHSKTGSMSLTFYECLHAALGKMASAVPKGAAIDALCIAMPGPVRGSGSRDSLDVATTAHHRNGWNGELIYNHMEAAVKDHKLHHLFRMPYPLFVYTDATAYCIGDYRIEVSAPKARTPPKVFAHLVVDEGVGGAILVNGEILDTGFHSEIGHLPLRRHAQEAESFMPHCPAHSFVGCAESYVSLAALRQRWGDKVHEELQNWGSEREELKLVAYYLAQICVSLILTTNAGGIRFSGRVARNAKLIEKVAEYTMKLLRVPDVKNEAYFPGYAFAPDFIRRRNDPDAGIYGCILLAHKHAYGGGIRR